jgi:hypothetical protein
MFGPSSKKQFDDGQLHSSEKVEMAVDEWFQIQEPNFWHNKTV